MNATSVFTQDRKQFYFYKHATKNYLKIILDNSFKNVSLLK